MERLQSYLVRFIPFFMKHKRPKLLAEGENRNWDKSAGVVADSWVTFGAINAESRFYYE